MASAPPVIDEDPPVGDPPAADPPASDPPASDPPAADPPAADPPAADWRTRMAGDDAKLLGYLGRYPTEKAFAEAAKKDREAARNGLKPLSDDPSPEELAAYRKNFGVPEKPEGYLEKLNSGLVVGADDRPIVDKFLAAMHEANAPASVTAKALDAYYGIVAEQDAAIAEATAAAKAACEDTLREEYGADYRRNVNAAESYLGTLPAEVQSAINGGFNDKGVPLKTDPAVMRWLVGVTLEANPHATLVPGGGADTGSAIGEEIAKIEGLMRTDRNAYNKDSAMQARYRELVTARDKLPK